MIESLVYQPTQDQEVFKHAEFQIGKEKLQRVNVSACTIAGRPERPNEDAYAITVENGILTLAIFDGCSSQKPIPALEPQTGARFASHFLKDTFMTLTNDVQLKDGMLSLNKKLLDMSKQLGGSLDDVHTLPVSTGTIVRVDADNQTMEFAHVGDTFVIVYYKDGTSELVTNDLNDKFDKEMFALMTSISKERGITPREARKDARVAQAIIDSFIRKFNTPNGMGCGYIDGDPTLEKYIQTRSISLAGISAILLGSDGLPPQGWSQTDEEGRNKLLNELQKGDFRQLIQAKKASEDNDPNWNYVRYKHSDDATGIFIQFA